MLRVLHSLLDFLETSYGQRQVKTSPLRVSKISPITQGALSNGLELATPDRSVNCSGYFRFSGCDMQRETGTFLSRLFLVIISAALRQKGCVSICQFPAQLSRFFTSGRLKERWHNARRQDMPQILNMWLPTSITKQQVVAIGNRVYCFIMSRHFATSRDSGKVLKYDSLVNNCCFWPNLNECYNMLCNLYSTWCRDTCHTERVRVGRLDQETILSFHMHICPRFNLLEALEMIFS